MWTTTSKMSISHLCMHINYAFNWSSRPWMRYDVKRIFVFFSLSRSESQTNSLTLYVLHIYSAFNILLPYLSSFSKMDKTKKKNKFKENKFRYKHPRTRAYVCIFCVHFHGHKIVKIITLGSMDYWKEKEKKEIPFKKMREIPTTPTTNWILNATQTSQENEAIQRKLHAFSALRIQLFLHSFLSVYDVLLDEKKINKIKMKTKKESFTQAVEFDQFNEYICVCVCSTTLVTDALRLEMSSVFLLDSQNHYGIISKQEFGLSLNMNPFWLQLTVYLWFRYSIEPFSVFFFI